MHRIYIGIFQRRHTDDQASKMILSITAQKRNANQNHNELLPHTYQNGYHQKETSSIGENV